MRILYLHQHYSAPSGSTATRSHAMARALTARGHAVTMACGRYAGAVSGLEGPFRRGRRVGRTGGIEVVEFDIPCGNAQGLGARGLAFLRFAARAAPLALARRFDLAIASSTPLTVTLPALLGWHVAGLPFVFEIRDPWPELPRAMLAGAGPGSLPVRAALAAMAPLANAACRRACAVVALSEGMAETAIARGADPAGVHVVPNGCDLDLFGPHIAPWRPEEARPWECLAVYAGAHGTANGLDRLLDAAALLRGESRLRLLLIGEGAEKQRLMRRAGLEGLANVTFLDPLPKTRLAALLAGSQIGVHLLGEVPEFAEWTAPNKLMDYLAAGLPVVTNVAGHAARLVADPQQGVCGIAVPPGDAVALAEALAALVGDPARRAAMGRAAREQAVRRWDRRLLAARFCDIVEAAADTPRALAAPRLRDAA
ncbi:MAG TPA: glycosyltransferase family 4 protein [Acetobacteraceae bacterium]|nr:glycosyltransferase family 4 protein [Acetobacteraceae bacterium]